MNKPYTIIQCSNYFEYMNFKDNFKDINFTYLDTTYTVKLASRSSGFLKYIKSFAPTATITQVSFRNGRATYLKLKD